jgi:hypothetical protein
MRTGNWKLDDEPVENLLLATIAEVARRVRTTSDVFEGLVYHEAEFEASSRVAMATSTTRQQHCVMEPRAVSRSESNGYLIRSRAFLYEAHEHLGTGETEDAAATLSKVAELRVDWSQGSGATGRRMNVASEPSRWNLSDRLDC